MTNWKMCFGDGSHYSEFKRKRRDPQVPDALTAVEHNSDSKSRPRRSVSN